MATLNVSNFEFELIKKIRNTTDDKELAILHKALNVLKTGAIFTVIQFSDLPDASDNVGKLYFVKNDSILYFSYVGFNNLEYWVPITQISANSLWTWGDNDYGQLGDGTTTSRRSPGTIVGGGINWCGIDGFFHNIAIKTDGTLWTWGRGNFGRLGNGTTVNRCSPGTVAGGGTTWCNISYGYAHSSAIKTDGTLWTWGRNYCGQLGDGTTLDRSSPGTVAGGGTTWCQIASGSAIKCDGTLWTWGSNNFGRLGDGTTVSRSSPGTVAGGGTTWCQIDGSSAIKTDGTLWTWGRNNYGQLGDGTTLNRCSPGTTWGSATNWCQVGNSTYHLAAIKTDGTLWTWGRAAGSGYLGDGTTFTSRCSPGTVAGGGTNWCRISPGATSKAVKTDGTLWTWGFNCYGRLGDGTTVSRCSPGTVAGGGTTWCQNFNISESNKSAIRKETL